ncbi:MAG: putative dehydrogenase [Candidatus Azotimanducaceae bacterium]|jgi:predicted dehydrogenase
MTIRLGIIGLSDGNGHPYSWAAIFNGYNAEAMENCGYPVIPRYLEKQSWPYCSISNAIVTSVWTQDVELSRHIARSSRIPKVCQSVEEMISTVDGVLLARDDCENHWRFAEPVLNSGKPIYIDKPIAVSLAGLNRLYDLEQYPGQIFTGSALRFSKELKLTPEELDSLGEIKHVIASTPKSWAKYAVHIIEPVLNLLPKDDKPAGYSTGPPLRTNSCGGCLSVIWESGVKTSFFAMGDALTPLSIRIHGTGGYKELTFTDSFTAFKATLEVFIEGIVDGTVASPKLFNTQVVTLLEKGHV